MNCKSIITRNDINYSNSKSCVSIQNGVLFIRIKSKDFDEYAIRQMISCVNYVHKKYAKTALPICVDFSNIQLVDKLSYTIFECICKTLIEDYKHRLFIKGNFKNGITTKGFASSPLQMLTGNRQAKRINSEFINRFNSDIYHCHYRKLFTYDEYHNHREKLSRTYDDICTFQKGFGINYDCLDEISEVIVELIGNSIEHSESDCILDIDIAPHYIKENENGEFCGINISVLNFSDILLGDNVKKKISKMIISGTEINNRYKKVIDAYNFHKSQFSDNYTETDFFNITSFQEKISGRFDNSSTGGTGLTLLIKSIQERADMDSCYVLSGDRGILLIRELLEYDNDEWLGFNKCNDYFNHIPEVGIVNQCNVFFPGTAYNLNFVMKVNDDE